MYVNPPKIALLPQYYREINIDWECYSVEDRERVRQALSETEVIAGNNFAPMRHSRRGPLVAPRSKPRRDPATPAMTNSTTTSPDIASDASTCSTPSPVNPIQIENDYSSPKPEKRKLSVTDSTKSISHNSSFNVNGDIPPRKKRLITPEKSIVASINREQGNSLHVPMPSIPKSSSQSDFQKMHSSPYLSKSFSSPQSQQNGLKANERLESTPKKRHRSKEKEYINGEK